MGVEMCTISFWFACKQCGFSFENIDYFIEHKREKHFLDVHRIRCIVFEERIIEIEEDPLPLPPSPDQCVAKKPKLDDKNPVKTPAAALSLAKAVISPVPVPEQIPNHNHVAQENCDIHNQNKSLPPLVPVPVPSEPSIPRHLEVPLPNLTSTSPSHLETEVMKEETSDTDPTTTTPTAVSVSLPDSAPPNVTLNMDVKEEEEKENEIDPELTSLKEVLSPQTVSKIVVEVVPDLNANSINLAQPNTNTNTVPRTDQATAKTESDAMEVEEIKCELGEFESYSVDKLKDEAKSKTIKINLSKNNILCRGEKTFTSDLNLLAEVASHDCAMSAATKNTNAEVENNATTEETATRSSPAINATATTIDVTCTPAPKLTPTPTPTAPKNIPTTNDTITTVHPESTKPEIITPAPTTADIAAEATRINATITTTSNNTAEPTKAESIVTSDPKVVNSIITNAATINSAEANNASPVKKFTANTSSNSSTPEKIQTLRTDAIAKTTTTASTNTTPTKSPTATSLGLTLSPIITCITIDSSSESDSEPAISISSQVVEPHQQQQQLLLLSPQKLQLQLQQLPHPLLPQPQHQQHQQQQLPLQIKNKNKKKTTKSPVPSLPLGDWLLREKEMSRSKLYSTPTNIILLEPDPALVDVGVITPANSISCKLCCKKLVSEREVKVHVKHCWLYNKKLHRYCVLCKRKFEDSFDYNKHFKSHLSREEKTRASQSKFKCNVCSKEFLTKTSFKFHTESHKRSHHSKQEQEQEGREPPLQEQSSSP